MFCSECGNEVNERAVVCPNCGVAIKGANSFETKKPGISRGWAAVASLLIVGLGQMLQGRVSRGIIWLLGGIVLSILTGGIIAPLIWIGAAVDAYMWNAYDFR